MIFTHSASAKPQTAMAELSPSDPTPKCPAHFFNPIKTIEGGIVCSSLNGKDTQYVRPRVYIQLNLQHPTVMALQGRIPTNGH
jgi:hypothetical protein